MGVYQAQVVEGFVGRRRFSGFTEELLTDVPSGQTYVNSDSAGNYSISYQPPDVTDLNPCGPPADQISLIVYANDPDQPTTHRC